MARGSLLFLASVLILVTASVADAQCPSCSTAISVGEPTAFCDGGCDKRIDGGCDSCGGHRRIGEALQRGMNLDASRLFLRVGAGGVFFQEAASINVGGPVTGASLLLEDNAAFLFDIGYRINDRWSFTLSSGVPPQTDLHGTGPHTGLHYGRTKYAPAIFSLQYHIPLDRFVQSSGSAFLKNSNVYVGGGFHHTWFYGSKDNTVSNLDVDDTWGGLVQVGFEKMLKRRLGLYLDYKQVFLQTEAHGNVGGTPMQADVIADPSVLSGGVILRR